MASCDSCKKTILFGGIQDRQCRFCSSKCQQAGQILRTASSLPDDLVSHHLNAIPQGSCPQCKGAGPVDVHLVHTVWSLIYLTSWKSTPHICCRRCGVKKQAGGLAYSLFLGWWGFPWGLIVTPAQIIRNIVGLSKGPEASRPSAALQQQIRLRLATHVQQQVPSKQTVTRTRSQL